MSEDTHDEHHDHSFPAWVTFGKVEDPVDEDICMVSFLDHLRSLSYLTRILFLDNYGYSFWNCCH